MHIVRMTHVSSVLSLSLLAAAALTLGASEAWAQPTGSPPPGALPPAGPGKAPPAPPGAAQPGAQPAPGAQPGATQPGYGPPPGAGAPPPGSSPPPGYGPPPGAGAPPPGYGPPGYGPPPGYAPPPGYGPPPGGYYGGPSPYYYYPPGNVLPPPTMPYQEGEPIPQGYTLKSRANKGLVIAGSITFGAPYIVSALVAATVISADSSTGKELGPLFIPCVGPFITIGTGRSEGAGTFWLVLDGLAQTGGVVMFIVGMVAQEKYLQRTGETPHLTATLRPEVLVGPGSGALKWRF